MGAILATSGGCKEESELYKMPASFLPKDLALCPQVITHTYTFVVSIKSKVSLAIIQFKTLAIPHTLKYTQIYHTLHKQYLKLAQPRYLIQPDI